MLQVTGNKADFREAKLDFLEKYKVRGWSDLPLWLPGAGETANFHRRSNAKAIRAGLTFRPVAMTVTDTRAWFKQQPPDRQAKLRAGLSAERETELLKLLG